MPKYIISVKRSTDAQHRFEELNGVNIEEALQYHRGIYNSVGDFFSRHCDKKDFLEYTVSLYVAKKADYDVNNPEDFILLKKSFVNEG